MTPQEQLQSLLRELFQLDNSDLDFGIYRILNLKHKEVEDFICLHLPKRISEVKGRILARQGTDLTAELEKLKQHLSANFQVDFQKDGDLDLKADQYGQLPMFKEPYDQFIQAKKKLDVLHVSADTERAIYNDLYRFFDRYYEEGDFVSKPRAGANNYMIPYNGEEVKLYWANHDQYYIKTGENFKNYVFTNNAAAPEERISVEFKIMDAETAINNNKDDKKRLFVPTGDSISWDEAERKLTISFEYKVPSADEKARWGEKQNVKSEDKGINQRLFKELAKFVTKTRHADLIRFFQKTRANTKGEEQSLFLFHLNRYTSINSFDYFIHKDLKSFLQRELDYFLKNEVLSVNFLDPDWDETEVQESIKVNTLKASAIRDLALTIIDFLAEMEEFQKRLFEKKKFVVQSDYCFTINKLNDEQIRKELIAYTLGDREKKQIKDWLEWGLINSEKDLRTNPGLFDGEVAGFGLLVFDTAHLPDHLKWKVLCSFDPLDGQINGLLVHSENWQALEFVKSKMFSKIKCIYIDPPFNLGEKADYSYKVDYKDSTWLSLLQHRLDLSKKILTNDGSIFVRCSHDGNMLVRLLMEQVFGSLNYRNEIIVRRAEESKGDLNKQFEALKSITVNYDNLYWFSRDIDTRFGRFMKPTNERQAQAHWHSFWKAEDRPRMRYEILGVDLTDKRGQWMWEPDRAYRARDNYKAYLKVQAKTGESLEQYWKKTGKKLEFVKREGNTIGSIKYWIPPRTEVMADNNWLDIKGYANTWGFRTENSEILLKRIFESLSDEGDWISDYFLGSGTATAAAAKLKRKYFGVEMGEQFFTKVLPRMKSVLAGDDTGISDDVGWKGEGFFQYLKLEQYEDTLNNIVFARDAAELPLVDRLRYLLTYGTQGSDCLLNVEKFTNPFSYTMSIVRQNEVNPEQPIDLVTTFNFFLGIDVRRYVVVNHQDCEYRIVLGKKRQQEYVVVWRQFEEGKLDLTKERDWIKAQPWYDAEAIVYCNADNAFGARSTEADFKRIMNEPVE